jgi:hypothetical protein
MLFLSLAKTDVICVFLTQGNKCFPDNRVNCFQFPCVLPLFIDPGEFSGRNSPNIHVFIYVPGKEKGDSNPGFPLIMHLN